VPPPDDDRPWTRRLARRPHLFTVAVAVVSVWAVVVNLARIGFAVIGFDEPFYALAGWRYIHGDDNHAPTQVWGNFDNFEHPPFAKYLFGVAQLIAGHQSVVADRVVAALCTLGTALVLGLWLGKTAGRWVGLGAAALVALLPMSVPGLPFRFGRYGYLDPVAELFAVSAVALAWVWFRRHGRAGWWWALATGASVGLAAASKENGFLGAVGPVLAGLALAVRDRRDVVRRLLQSVAAVLTACLVFAVTYLGLGHPVEAFQFMRRFQHLHASLGHSVEFAGRVTQHPPWWAFLWFVQHGIGALVTVACLLCVLAAIVLRRDRLVVWCLAALAGPLVFHMVIAPVVLSYYWVMWMPLFLALVALGVGELLGSRRQWSRDGFRVGARIIGAAAVAVLAGAAVHDTYRTLTLPDTPHRNTSYSTAVLARSPLTYLRLGERSGVTATDSSGRGHPGTYVNNPTLGVPGLLTDDPDPSVTFNGSSQYARIPGAPWMNVDTYSFAVWFRATRPSQYVVSHDNLWGSKVWDLSLDKDGHLQCVTFAPFTGGGQTAVSTGVFDDGVRHMAVCTKSGHVLELYVDGRLAASKTYPAFIKSTTPLPIELARRGDGSGSFAGTVDEFAFFGTALRESDVAALYSAGSLPTPGR